MGFRETFTANLPPDPDQALLVMADRASEWLESPEDGNSQIQSVIIISILKAFVQRFRPEIVVFGDGVKDYVFAIMEYAGTIEVERILAQYEDTVASKESFGRAELTSEEKSDLHEHLGRLRKLIESSDLAPRKKNGLLGRINELAAEIDRFGTRTDRFFAFASDLGFYMGDFAKKTEPVWTEIKEVLRIVTKARSREEGVALPPGDEVLHLPKPETGDDASEGEK